MFQLFCCFSFYIFDSISEEGEDKFYFALSLLGFFFVYTKTSSMSLSRPWDWDYLHIFVISPHPCVLRLNKLQLNDWWTQRQ